MIIPMYIQETRRRDETLIVVRPLFHPEPEHSAELLSRAMARFAHDFRKHVDGLVKQDRHDALAQLSFAPDLETLAFDETLELRRQTLRCRFLLVHFRAFDRRIGFSPSVPEVWFDIAKGQDIRTRALEAYADHFRELERELGPRTLPPPAPDYVRGWVNTLDFDVSLYKPVTKSPRDKFAALFEPAKMDGREELDKVGRRLESLYPDDLEHAVLREKEVDDLFRRLREPERRPVLLVGPRQVGKTAIVHECVFRKLRDDPRQFRHHQDIWLLSPQRLISGMMYAGQWESRLLAILAWAKQRDHVLYFDDLLGLFLAGMSASSDLNVAQVLRPCIERREVRVLGEATPEALRALQERDRGFADLFEIVRIAEPAEDDARRILIAVARDLEGRHRCTFDLDVLPTLWDLQRRYARDQALPGKVAGFLRRLAAKYAGMRVTREDLLEEYHRRSGIALGLLDRKRKLERRTVLEALAAHVAGQPDALAAMADAVSIAKAQLNDPARPLATFLFLGPTGVGKTQSAKAVATYLFGQADRLLRLDMNEYVDPRSAPRLIGTWRDPEGILTSAIRRQPYAVVLLDEIEKAHGDVHDMLLQLLGEGRLTDALGRTADFTNAVIIMTSNLGVREAEAAFGFGAPTRQAASHAAAYRHAAERFFRPEFFNRIDRIVPFARLSRDHTAGIARRLIDEVFTRDGFRQRRAILCVEDAALDRIVDQGYQPQFGARALKRAVEDQLTRPVAAQLAALEPGVPTLVNVFPAGSAIGVALQPLRYATAAALPPLENAAAVLDAVDEAMVRLDPLIAALQPRGRVAVDAVSSPAARYFALREQQGRVDRMLERLGRAEARGQIHAVRTRTGVGVRGGNKRGVLAADSRRKFADVFAADDLRQYLATLAAQAAPYGATGQDQLRELIAELALLETMANGGGANHAARILLAVRDMVPRAQRAQVAAAFYQTGLDAQHLTRKKRPDPHAGWSFLLITSAEAAALAARETGIQLFVSPDQGLQPVQVVATPVPDDQEPVAACQAFPQRFADHRAALAAGANDPGPATLGDVLRVHDQTTLELRSGLVLQPEPSRADIRAVLIAALPCSPELRRLAAGGPDGR